jgi:inosose dehydratase
LKTGSISRRTFNKHLGALISTAALSTPAAFAERTRKVHVGHTGITWSNSNVDQAIRDVGELGFYGFETFGEVLARKDAQGDLQHLLDSNHLYLISGYCTINLTDATKRTDELAKVVTWSRLIKKYGGRIFVLGPNQVKRDTYDFRSAKAGIVSMVNEVAKTVGGEGLTPVLHQHTGTCVESRDETYETLHSVDTNVIKFGPDVGQLMKGGVDPVQVVKDFLPIVQHMHLKDYNGRDEHLLGYCPLGQGNVNVPGILDLMEGRQIRGMIMVELDNNPRDPSPVSPHDLVAQSVKYLKSIGVKLRG